MKCMYINGAYDNGRQKCMYNASTNYIQQYKLIKELVAEI